MKKLTIRLDNDDYEILLMLCEASNLSQNQLFRDFLNKNISDLQVYNQTLINILNTLKTISIILTKTSKNNNLSPDDIYKIQTKLNSLLEYLDIDSYGGN